MSVDDPYEDDVPRLLQDARTLDASDRALIASLEADHEELVSKNQYLRGRLDERRLAHQDLLDRSLGKQAVARPNLRIVGE